jgi:hypothetical protein
MARVRRELAEHERAVVFFAQLAGQAHERGQLGPRHRRVRVHQARVTGHAAQARERGQQLEALTFVVGQVAQGVAALGLVERALLGRQLHAVDDLRARRQLGRHGALGAAQDERPQRLAQGLALARVVVALDGQRVALAEVRPGAEQARVHHAHEAVELAQVVLHGRARERHAHLRVDRAHRLGALRAGVLDGLRLVHHQHAEAGVAHQLHVARERVVAGDEHLVGLELFQQLRAPRAAVHDGHERGRESA